MASDVGTLARFPKTVGNDSLTRDVAVSARDFPAEEALRAGFLSKVVPGGQKAVLRAYSFQKFNQKLNSVVPILIHWKWKHKYTYIEIALKTAQDIATKSPIAIVSTKRVLLHARDHRSVRFFPLTPVQKSDS